MREAQATPHTTAPAAVDAAAAPAAERDIMGLIDSDESDDE